MGERNGLYWDNTGREQGGVREERPQVILPQRELWLSDAVLQLLLENVLFSQAERLPPCPE